MANPAATSRTALHLSNILKYNVTESPGVMDVTETRALHAQLCGPLEMIEQTLSLSLSIRMLGNRYLGPN